MMNFVLMSVLMTMSGTYAARMKRTVINGWMHWSYRRQQQRQRAPVYSVKDLCCLFTLLLVWHPLPLSRYIVQ